MAAKEAAPPGADLQRRWVEERDNQLVEWFADGLHDEEILALAQDQGFDLSLKGVKDARTRLTGRSLACLAARGPQHLNRIARAHKSARVHEANQLCEVLRRAEQKCESDPRRFNVLVRLVEAHLKALRYLGEEVRDLQPATQGVEHLAVMIRKASPEQRKRFTVLYQEIKAVLEVAEADNEEPLPILEAGTLSDAND